MAKTDYIPLDLRRDIAASVRQFDVEDGFCVFRAMTGLSLLRFLGIDSELAFGGLRYRVGPGDPIGFCGPDGRGRMIDNAFRGHCWLTVGDDLVDFSAGDWRRQMENFRDGLGPVRWTVADPPEFVWQPRASLQKGQALGEFRYTTWTGEDPPVSRWFEAFTSIPITVFSDHIAQCCKRYSLRERVARARRPNRSKAYQVVARRYQ
jgi:hypothetical protein